MLAHCRITALMVVGFLLLNAASDARAALNWINVSPGGNYTVIGMLNIGGNVTSSGLTPTVTAVKITLTEDSSGNKLLLNVEAAWIYDYYTGQRIAYLRTYDLPNPGDYTLELKAYNTDSQGNETELGSPPNYPLTLTKQP